MLLLVKILLNIPKGLSKWRFLAANISKKKADFDPRPPPMENMDLYLLRIPSLGGGRTNAWPRKSI
jgi:hypothetical protein